MHDNLHQNMSIPTEGGDITLLTHTQVAESKMSVTNLNLHDNNLLSLHSFSWGKIM
jgi:hypothetical protein